MTNYYNQLAFCTQVCITGRDGHTGIEPIGETEVIDECVNVVSDQH